MKLPLWLSMSLLLFCLSSLSAGEKHFLHRKGAQLLMGEAPFRSVGVNKHELLDMYLADFLGQDLEASLTAARRSLDALRDLGVNVVRVRGSQFWPAQIEKTYLGGDEARSVFWKRYDMMLADCQTRGLRVVLTIAWHLGAWPDLGHESLQEFAGNPYSTSRQLFQQWVSDLVIRYRDNDTILFWELTNEANLGADLRPQFPEGIIPPGDLSKPHGHIVSDPVVRDHATTGVLKSWLHSPARLPVSSSSWIPITWLALAFRLRVRQPGICGWVLYAGWVRWIGSGMTLRSRQTICV